MDNLFVIPVSVACYNNTRKVFQYNTIKKGTLPHFINIQWI